MQCSKRTISVHKSNSVGNINFLLLFATNSSFPRISEFKLLSSFKFNLFKLYFFALGGLNIKYKNTNPNKINIPRNKILFILPP